jgi:hypothetical protein
MAYNLIERPHLHAPDVVQQKNFVYRGIAYIKCGRATDIIAGQTAEWVRRELLSLGIILFLNRRLGPFSSLFSSLLSSPGVPLSTTLILLL